VIQSLGDPELCFLLTPSDQDRIEKTCFFQAQVELLRQHGMIASFVPDVAKLGKAGPGGRIVIFDVAGRRDVAHIPQDVAPGFAPLVWNPYALFQSAMDWIRQETRVLAVLAPDPAQAKVLKRYPLARKVGTVRIAMHYGTDQEQGRDRGEGPPVIGCLGQRTHAAKFISGVLRRHPANMGRFNWIELDFEDREAWLRNLPRCSMLLSTRSYSGSALPLLEAMASDVLVCADHGGALSELASSQNGFWLESATSECNAEVAGRALECIGENGPALDSILARARKTAAEASATATFPETLHTWRALVAEAAPT
jgi:hypothetical protein